MNLNKNCIDCGVEHDTVVNEKPIPRCLPCHRSVNAKTMARARLRKKKAMLALNDESTGWKICSKCVVNKRLSEFTTNRKDGSGRLNKLCDGCLTAVYTSDSRRSEGFDEVWWRQRAYSCNSTGRTMLAKQLGVPIPEVKTESLPYVCKPQDIAAIFQNQGGLCHYCAVILTPKTTSIDHAQPLSRGGSHTPDNFRVACGDCNRFKWTRSESEFVEFLSEFQARLSNRTSG